MKKLNITYSSVTKEEFIEDLGRLIMGVHKYIEDFSESTDEAHDFLGRGNIVGCIEYISNARDLLASADLRLHDIMNNIIKLVEAESPPVPNDVADTETPNEILTKDVEVLDDRMSQIKKNIADLGIEISQEEMNKVMERINDKAS